MKRLTFSELKGKYRLFLLWVAVVGVVCTFGKGLLYDAVSWVEGQGIRGLLFVLFVQIPVIVYHSFRIKNKVEHTWLTNALLVIAIVLCLDAIRLLGIKESATIWTVLFLSAIWLMINVIIVNRQKGKESFEKTDGGKFMLLREAPTNKDDYKRKSLACHLVHSIIEDSRRPSSEILSAYTFNIDEEYGRGKSSFFMLIEEQLKQNHCLYFFFLPWRSPSPASMVKTFFVELQEVLSPLVSIHTILNLRKYTALAIENVVKSKGLDVSDLFGGLKQSQNDYYDEIAEALKNIRRPIVVLVDDVDRLRKEELVALLCLIRNTAAFPYLYFVLASDREYILNTLSSNSYDKQEVDFYLQKIINMNILFPSVDRRDICEDLNKLLHKTLEAKGVQKEDVEKVYDEISGKEILDVEIERVFNNYRMVNRFFSMLRFDISQYDDKTFLENIYPQDYVKIELVKYLRPDVYKMLRDYPFELLESSQKDTRYVLVNDCKIFVSRKALKFAESAKNEMDMKQGNAEIEKKGKNEMEDLTDKKESRGKVVADYVNQLLSDMFYDDDNYKEELSIRKYKSYDFYFTPILHHDALTFSQFLEIFNSNDSIAKELPEILQHGQEQAYFRNMRQLFQHPDKITNKVEALKKLFLSIEIIETNNDKPSLLSNFDMQKALFDRNVKYVVYEFFGENSKNKIELSTFTDFLREDGFLYSKMLLVGRALAMEQNIFNSLKEREEIINIIYTKSIEYISNFKTVKLEEILAVDDFCQSNYGSQWITLYREHLKGCDMEEVLFLLRSCVYWNEDLNCYQIISDVTRKLFTYENDIFQYLQSCRKESEIETILEFFLHKKDISKLQRGEWERLFGEIQS